MLSSVVPSDREVAAMSDRRLRSYEAQVRRAAKRQGLSLVKSRRRDPNAYDYGLYGLVEVTSRGGHWRSRSMVMGDQNTSYGFSLREIHAALVERGE